ncbi:synaptic vesicle glycoprotein 2C-like isoform X1 [Galleria mellonella]|uniref:Synaptic vesicle glycoprotein 2C-like isoform X1 n=2 Tax=Galleria mellonella TaxID=7137 RepID=A0A6J1WKJ8_GALME|nr:synaptic vesicle glycoprotein 2C-like isoform X1 [Galleria mellonella]
MTLKTEETSFDEALERTGNGLYNVLLLLTSSLLLLAIGVDLFGFTLVVATACDLQLTVSQKGVLSSLPFAGIILVSYFWGYISDTKGRRFTLVVSMQVGFVLSCLCSISPHWIVLGLIKFLSVCFSCAANSVTYTLVGESCVQRVRSKYMLLMTSLLLLSPAVAAVLAYPTLSLDFELPLPGIAVIFRPWRLLMIVLALPSGIGGVAIYFFYESPKFLAYLERNEEALEVLKSIYEINHRYCKEDFKVHSIVLSEDVAKKQTSLLRRIYEQSAPLFRRPLLFRTMQLFYIVAVVYLTNNTSLVWLSHILNLVRLSLENGAASGNICSLISNDVSAANTAANSTSEKISPEICLGYIKENVILTFVATQTTYAFLNFLLAYLPNHRRLLVIAILCLSSISGVLLNLMPEPISSVFFFMLFTCTCLCMGVLASYFVDLYPTSCRGMVACLSVMVGRSSTFVGINLIGNLIFYHCQVTFYLWSLLVLSSVVAAWFLPPDKAQTDATVV